jgi:hypothetical protein
MNKKIISLEVMQKLVTEIHLEALQETLDRLHDGASEGTLAAVTPLNAESLIGWLEDLIYTAQETICELRRDDSPSDTAEHSNPVINYQWSVIKKLS